MTTTAADIEGAAADDLSAIVALLASERLPVADLGAAALANFIVARDDGRVVGVAALEPYGEDGLLRSLVVAPERRGRGLGGALVEAVGARAGRLSLRALWLLTQTAAPFFAGRGWAAAARTEAPPAVAASTEFAALCPASAACMRKRLDQPTTRGPW